MFRLFIGVILGIGLVGWGWWRYSDGGRRDPVEGLKDAVRHEAGKATEAVERKLSGSFDGLKDQLGEKGKLLTQEVGDTRLLATIKAKLIREKSFDGFKVDVDVNEGVVTLKGIVPTREARDLVLKLARETEGVKAIRYDLRPPSPPEEK